jgi:hypothetical protein
MIGPSGHLADSVSAQRCIPQHRTQREDTESPTSRYFRAPATRVCPAVIKRWLDPRALLLPMRTARSSRAGGCDRRSGRGCRKSRQAELRSGAKGTDAAARSADALWMGVIPFAPGRSANEVACGDACVHKGIPLRTPNRYLLPRSNHLLCLTASAHPFPATVCPPVTPTGT